MTDSDAMDRLPARLANWRRWLRSGRRTKQAGSAEGFFRSPQHWHPAGPRPTEPRAADAWDLELAAATLPLRLHAVLRLRYVILFDDQTAAEWFRREFGGRTKPLDIEHMAWEAKGALLDALAQPLVIRRYRAVERVRAIIAKAEDQMVD